MRPSPTLFAYLNNYSAVASLIESAIRMKAIARRSLEISEEEALLLEHFMKLSMMAISAMAKNDTVEDSCTDAEAIAKVARRLMYASASPSYRLPAEKIPSLDELQSLWQEMQAG